MSNLPDLEKPAAREGATKQAGLHEFLCRLVEKEKQAAGNNQFKHRITPLGKRALFTSISNYCQDWIAVEL